MEGKGWEFAHRTSDFGFADDDSESTFHTVVV